MYMQGQATVCSTSDYSNVLLSLLMESTMPVFLWLFVQPVYKAFCNQWSEKRVFCGLFSFSLSNEQANQKKLSKKKVIDGFTQEGDEVTQLRGREEGRGGQKIIFYFVLEKSYEKSKPFLFETEETNHSSEVHGELVHSLSKRWTGWTDSVSWMQKILWKYINSFIVLIWRKHLEKNYLYYQLTHL